MRKNTKYIDSYPKLTHALENLNTLDVVGFDVETTGLDPLKDKIILLQVGTHWIQYVFDVYKLGDSIKKVIHYLNKTGLTKIAHNAKFDYSMVKGNFGVSLENIICTWVGSTLLTKGIKSADNSLDGCLNKYLNVKIDKSAQKSFIGMKWGEEFTREQIDYAGTDVGYLEALYNKINELIEDREMSLLSKLENEAIRVCGDMEINGFYLDTSMWLALRDKAVEGADKAKAELDAFFKPLCRLDLFGNPVVLLKNKHTSLNYNSPSQIKPLLEKITGEVIESTGEPELKKLKHPVIKSLLSYREAQKKITTYGREFIEKHVHPVTGRVHSSFKQLGTDSGRMASRSPNLQNIPSAKAYRECFRPQDERTHDLICADFSGQELRLLAQISKEKEFIYALDNNMDLHSYSASLIFGIDYKSFFYFGEEGKGEAIADSDGYFKKETLGLQEDGTVIDSAGDPIIRPSMKKKFRTPAKSITFGLVYGMGPGKLADTLEISIKAAKELIEKYFETFPKIRETLDYFTDLAMKNKYAYSPLDGRRRIFSGVDWDHGGKVAHLKNVSKNHPFQGAGASVTKLALCRMKRTIDDKGWAPYAKIVNVVHDEIIIECHVDYSQKVAKELETQMIEAFNFYAPDVSMVAKAEIGKYWIH
jgi:DNA polymerase I-like protein with 3'-5' exonuclease and polymerase domains